MAEVNRMGADLAGIHSADRRIAVWLVLGFTALRVVAGHFLGLGVDESYAVTIGRDISWSYFDHPPLTFWLARASALLFGSEAHLAVRAPFLLLGTGTAVLVYLLTERLFGSRAGVWALAAWSIAPFFLISAASWIVPDGPLEFFLLLTAWFAWPLMAEDERRGGARWLLVGLALGLALLSKYHALLFAAGALGLLLTTERGRDWLRTPWPYAAGLLALVMFAPVIWWNAQYDWPSFAFQSSRAGGGGIGANVFNGLRLIAGEMLYVLPATLVIGVWAAVLAARRGPADLSAWFCLWLGAPVFLAFNLVAFASDSSLPHWPMPGFLFFFPLLGVWLVPRAAQQPVTTRWSFVIGGAFTVLALAGLTVQSETGLLTRAFGPPERWDDTTQVSDWDAAAEGLEARGLLNEDTVVAAQNWIDASKLGYALGGRVPVVVLSEDARHFRYTAPVSRHAGRPAVLVVPVPPGRRDIVVPDALAGAIGAFCGETSLAAIDWPRGGVAYAHFSVVTGRICQ